MVEGERTRVQAFEGVCIARSNKGLNSNFTVRKISYGEGVERVFPLYSPTIAEIEVVRRGDVRRAKLYYLRGRSGKSARIAEKARDDGDPARAAEPAAPRPPRQNLRLTVGLQAEHRCPEPDAAHAVRQDLGQPRRRAARRTAPASSTSTATSSTR